MQKFILIAEDLASSRIMLESLVKKQGHRTMGVDGGYRCVQVARERKPDLILLDIMMPDISGIDVCRQLRSHAATAAIPVIFVTGATDDATLSRAFDAGASDYVRKPVNQVELVKRIQAVFELEQLQMRRQEEQQLLNVLSMSGTICHELNQPLQYLSGMLQLLERELAKGSAAHARVEKMQQQVERMGEITGKLMRLTKVEAKSYVGSSRILKLE